jgi:hypothetical protein
VSDPSAWPRGVHLEGETEDQAWSPAPPGPGRAGSSSHSPPRTPRLRP